MPTDTKPVPFLGYQIVRSGILALASELAYASEIVLAGSSAGAVGILNHGFSFLQLI